MCTVLAFIGKCAIWWWALVFRASEEGRVAAGRMIAECEEAHPDLGSLETLANTVAEAIISSETAESETVTDSNRLL